MVGTPHARGAKRLVGQEQETGRRVWALRVASDRLGGLRGKHLGPAHRYEPAIDAQRQGRGRPHDLVGAALAGVEDLAPPGRQRPIGKEPAGRGVERVVEELHVAAVQQDQRGRLAPLGLLQERRVVQIKTCRRSG